MNDLKEILKTVYGLFKEDPIGSIGDLLLVVFLFVFIYFLLCIAG
jgi:hypothetical protein